MPAQSNTSGAVYYVEFDNAPPLTACLKDGNEDPIDLTGATVKITIAFAMPRGTYYTSPRDQIVVRSDVDVDADQVNNKGFVSWTPGAQGDDDALTPPGQFLYIFEVTYQDGTRQTIPANTYQTMIITSPVGGRSLNA